MSVFQIVYISFSTPSFDQHGETACMDILTTARKFNSENNITGMLLYKAGVFLQLLEGDKKDVLSLFGRIATDPRHESISTLLTQVSNERIFEHWSMGYGELDGNLAIDLINSAIPWNSLCGERSEKKIVPKEDVLELFYTFRYKLGKEAS